VRISGSLQSFYPERLFVKTNFHNMYRRAVRELGVSGAQLARRFTMTQAGVGYAVRRGEKIVKEKAILMIE
jgi:hypothetical protein